MWPRLSKDIEPEGDIIDSCISSQLQWMCLRQNISVGRIMTILINFSPRCSGTCNSIFHESWMLHFDNCSCFAVCCIFLFRKEVSSVYKWQWIRYYKILNLTFLYQKCWPKGPHVVTWALCHGKQCKCMGMVSPFLGSPTVKMLHHKRSNAFHEWNQLARKKSNHEVFQWI